MANLPIDIFSLDPLYELHLANVRSKENYFEIYCINSYFLFFNFKQETSRNLQLDPASEENDDVNLF